MTNTEIIKKVIKIVRDRGYKKYHSNFAEDWGDDDVRSMVFDKGFAKVFWGEEIMGYGRYGDEIDEAWLYHLMMMIREEEPLKYIETYMRENGL